VVLRSVRPGFITMEQACPPGGPRRSSGLFHRQAAVPSTATTGRRGRVLRERPRRPAGAARSARSRRRSEKVRLAFGQQMGGHESLPEKVVLMSRRRHALSPGSSRPGRDHGPWVWPRLAHVRVRRGGAPCRACSRDGGPNAGAVRSPGRVAHPPVSAGTNLGDRSPGHPCESDRSGSNSCDGRGGRRLRMTRGIAGPARRHRWLVPVQRRTSTSNTSARRGGRVGGGDFGAGHHAEQPEVDSSSGQTNAGRRASCRTPAPMADPGGQRASRSGRRAPPSDDHGFFVFFFFGGAVAEARDRPR